LNSVKYNDVRDDAHVCVMTRLIILGCYSILVNCDSNFPNSKSRNRRRIKESKLIRAWVNCWCSTLHVGVLGHFNESGGDSFPLRRPFKQKNYWCSSLRSLVSSMHSRVINCVEIRNKNNSEYAFWLSSCTLP
jgi:hypothetical protein